VTLVVHVEPVMGTVVSFRAETSGSSEAMVRDAIAEAVRVLHRHDELFSLYMPKSPMSQLRAGQLRLVDVPTEIVEVLELCELARLSSGGWFDAGAMPGGIDPTGLVKGWSAAKALAVLEGAGVGAALVNAGGDIACFGSPSEGGRYRIGIRHPFRHDALACILEIDAAVATSGSYERGRHLVDPIGRRGPEIASATVTGPSLAWCDALATAAAVGGDDVVAHVTALQGYAVYLIRADGSELSTRGISFVTQPTG